MNIAVQNRTVLMSDIACRSNACNTALHWCLIRQEVCISSHSAWQQASSSALQCLPTIAHSKVNEIKCAKPSQRQVILLLFSQELPSNVRNV